VRSARRLLAALGTVLALIASSGVAAAGSPSWSTQALHWSVGGPTDSYLNEVSCVSTTCVGVGYAENASDTLLPLIAVKASGVWTRVPETLPASVEDLTWLSVSCVSETSCEGIGEATTSRSTEMVALDRSGSTWTVSLLPVLTGWSSPQVASISCAVASCVAVGIAQVSDQSIPVVETLSGSIWTASTVSVPSGSTDTSFANVACVDATDCTADGFSTNASDETNPIVAVEASGSWTIQVSTPPTGTSVGVISELSCWTATNCLAVGESGAGNGIVLSISGATIAYGSIPNLPSETYEELTAIRCFSATSCEAVGTTGNGTTSAAVAASFSGSTWTQRKLPVPSRDNFGIAVSLDCSSVTQCETVGWAGLQFEGAAPPPSTYLAYAATLSGTTWELDPLVIGGPPAAALFGISCSSGGDCVSVGRYSNDLEQDRPIVESLRANTWSLSEPSMPTGATSATLFAVTCPTAGSCVAVGRFVASSGEWLPYVDVLAKGTWKAKAVPSKNGFINVGLFGVSCVSVTECVAVGAASMNTSSNPFCSVNCTQAPIVERLIGTKWTESTPPSPVGNVNPILQAVSCWAIGQCVAVGAYYYNGFQGNVETLSGTKWRWSRAAAPTGGTWAELNGVACTSKASCHLVGDFEEGDDQYPLVETGGGGHWVPSAPDTTAPMSGDFGGIACQTPNDCVAVGTDGTNALIGELSGGVWTTSTLPLPNGSTGEDLYAASCPKSGSCHAAGEHFSNTADGPAVASQ
jgi:hypothetical protein